MAVKLVIICGCKTYTYLQFSFICDDHIEDKNLQSVNFLIKFIG